MLNMRVFAALGLIFLLSVNGDSRALASVSDCGDVSIAGMNWATAEITTAVDLFVLTEGYGCSVELNSSDAVPALVSMRDTGKPDLIPELWVNPVMPQVEQAVESGTIRLASQVLAEGGREGWWIPSYIAEAHPEIKSVNDALARPDLFPSIDEDSKAALHNCPTGWDCSIATANLFKAYAAEEKGFKLIEETSAAGLDASLAMAYEAQQGWLGYYWAPTSILGRYSMVRLDSGEHDEEQWETCITVPDCINPQPTAWPVSPVLSLVSQNFADSETAAMEYVSTRQWQNDMLNALLVWRVENQASGDEVARHFLSDYETIWTRWVPADIVAKLKLALEKEHDVEADGVQ